MHVGDTIFIFCLALIIFGPKKLPEIGRQIGKLMVEFRRASNDFKMQIEEELRASEQAERQKEITAANTMLPSAASSTAALATGASTAGPKIAPPSTGLPVNHTFPSTATEVTETAAEAPAQDAYPEPAEGFNPGLNTAANAEAAEVPAEVSFPTEVFEPAEPASELSEIEKAQAPVHHG
jgi:sec-independent protein translocase protein TatB